MVKAEAVEALLYASVTWILRQEHYKKLRTVHHWVLLRIIRRQGQSRDYRNLSYCKDLQAANCESIETTVKTWRLLWAGAVMRKDARRLPRRLHLGKLDGARKRGRGGKEKEWVDCVEKDVRALGILGDWEALSLQEDEWYNTVVEGGRRFMDAWRRIEEQASETRQEKKMERKTGNASVVPKFVVG